MQQTIDETERRRSLQLAYNEEHGITPAAIIKARNAIIGREMDDDVPAAGKPRKRQEQKRGGKKPMYTEEFAISVDIAADPVIPYMNREELERMAAKLRSEMLEAAKKMEFIEAARLRDEIIKIESRLETTSKQ